MNTAVIVALTIFGEAAGESLEGKRAVASVIWERAGGDCARLVEVCRAPRQFSCWNDRVPRVRNDYPSRRAWRECLAIAQEMVGGTFAPTIRATHYHAASVSPKWASGMRLVAVIGGHRFYMESTKQEAK